MAASAWLRGLVPALAPARRTAMRRRRGADNQDGHASSAGSGAARQGYTRVPRDQRKGGPRCRGSGARGPGTHAARTKQGARTVATARAGRQVGACCVPGRTRSRPCDCRGRARDGPRVKKSTRKRRPAAKPFVSAVTRSVSLGGGSARRRRARRRRASRRAGVRFVITLPIREEAVISTLEHDRTSAVAGRSDRSRIGGLTRPISHAAVSKPRVARAR
jgi:hypothetical protein